MTFKLCIRKMRIHFLSADIHNNMQTLRWSLVVFIETCNLSRCVGWWWDAVDDYDDIKQFLVNGLKWKERFSRGKGRCCLIVFWCKQNALILIFIGIAVHKCPHHLMAHWFLQNHINHPAQDRTWKTIKRLVWRDSVKILPFVYQTHKSLIISLNTFIVVSY